MTGGGVVMRLVCPNCDAQYEVDDAAIPEEGRDVQCSNCGHAWFQLPAGVADPETEEDDAALFPQPEPAPVAAPGAPQTAAPQPVTEPQPVPAPAAADAPPAPPRRTLDESVLAVLREEAEREATARRAEAARSVEVQTDLGLPAPPPAAARMATEVSADPDAPASARGDTPTQPPGTPRPGARRDLLPDIEEINSTLRAGSEARSAAAADAAQVAVAARSGGFRAGFVTMLVAAVLLVALYVMAPRIAQHLPGSAAAMEGYVATIDGARLWLDGALQSAVTALRGVSGQGG